MANYSDKRCNGCPYHNQKHLIGSNAKYVTNRPNPPLEMEDNGSNILLVFQSPGENEWKYGKPVYFNPTCSKNTAGARLEKTWKSNKKSRTDFNITNIVQCFQGKKNGSKDDDKLDSKAKRHCLDYLIEDLKKYQGKRIVVFGYQAKQQVKRAISRGNLSFSELKYINHPTAKRGKPSDDVLSKLFK